MAITVARGAAGFATLLGGVTSIDVDDDAGGADDVGGLVPVGWRSLVVVGADPGATGPSSEQCRQGAPGGACSRVVGVARFFVALRSSVVVVCCGRLSWSSASVRRLLQGNRPPEGRQEDGNPRQYDEEITAAQRDLGMLRLHRMCAADPLRRLRTGDANASIAFQYNDNGIAHRRLPV